MTHKQSIPSAYPRTIINILLVVFVIMALPLLFTPKLNFYQHRLLPHYWNLGHILLFFAVVWLLINHSSRLQKIHFFALLLFINLAIFFIGFLVEYYQVIQGRESSFEDIYRNCLGGSLGILFHPNVKTKSHIDLNISRAIAIVLVLHALFPAARNTLDWIISQLQFPILSNFETPFEAERWSGNRFKIEFTDSGNRSLQTTFDTSRFSAVHLLHFPADWRGYGCFSFRIHNVGDKNLHLRLKINDREHIKKGQNYYDRFNHQITATPGWNLVRLTLDNVRLAPHTREMNMANIERITLFSVELPEPAKVQIDDFALSREVSNCN